MVGLLRIGEFTNTIFGSSHCLQRQHISFKLVSGELKSARLILCTINILTLSILIAIATKESPYLSVEKNVKMSDAVGNFIIPDIERLPRFLGIGEETPVESWE